jgi:transcriptional regulator with XRE-family HTH domain
MKREAVRQTLAENIKLFRGRRNWSQADLAEQAGLSVVYLSDIERGNKWPYLDTLVKLASAFELEVYELLKPEDSLEADTAAVLARFTEETVSMITKSLDSAKKSACQSLIKLRDQYLMEAE